MNEPNIFFQGEVMLLDWSDTGRGGRKVVLALDHEAPVHPFAGEKSKSGKTLGQRYMAVLVKLRDDETPEEKTPSQMAFLLCKDEAFWEFLSKGSFVPIQSEEDAKASICEACGIKSRSELDTNPAAQRMWLANFFEPFLRERAEASKVKL